ARLWRLDRRHGWPSRCVGRLPGILCHLHSDHMAVLPKQGSTYIRCPEPCRSAGLTTSSGAADAARATSDGRRRRELGKMIRPMSIAYTNMRLVDNTRGLPMAWRDTALGVLIG